MLDNTIINVDSALEQLGDMDFYLELIDELIEGIPEKKKVISISIENGDDNELRLVAHSIKGVSANLHLPGVRAAASNLENAVKSAETATYKNLEEILFSAFDQLVSEREKITA